MTSTPSTPALSVSEDGSRRSRRMALLALALLVPVPSIGTIMAMHVAATEGTQLGQGLFFLSKAWLIALPGLWLLLVERGRLSLSPPRHGGFKVGIGLGLLISAVVVVGYLLFGGWIDPTAVSTQAAEAGIGTLPRYIAFAAFLVTINAVLEEYVWRWFVVRQCERLFPSSMAWIAVPLSAALFTVHHVFALAAQFDWRITLLGSAGVFIGGVVWSWCYRRYRSIWPGFVSHGIVDVTILLIGAKLIFGS